MDAGSSLLSSSPSSSNHSAKTISRCPLQEQLLNRKPSRENLDRFIPNRSAMDFDYAHYMLTEGKKGKQNSNTADSYCSPSKEAYRKLLAETFNMDRTSILVFKNKFPTPVDLFPKDYFSDSISNQSSKPTKPRRHVPQSSERTLGAPDILDDYYLNLLDWGKNNVLSIALGSTMYLWDASDGATSELVTVDDETGS